MSFLGKRSNVENKEARPLSGKDNNKYFTVPRNESKDLIILDNIQIDRVMDETIGVFRHTYYNPVKKFSEKVTCEAGNAEDNLHKRCRICAEMMARPKDIKRTFFNYFTVIDLSLFEDEQGNKWTHTIKLWELTNHSLQALHSSALVILKSGTTAFVKVTVSRVGDKAAASGSNFTPHPDRVKAGNLLSSMRIPWFQEKVKKETGNNISPTEAAGRYFRVMDYESVLKPTEEQIEYFLSVATGKQIGYSPNTDSSFNFGANTEGDNNPFSPTEEPSEPKIGSKKSDIEKAMNDQDPPF